MVGRDEPSGTTVDPDDWFEGRGADLLEESPEHTSGDARGDDRMVAAAGEPGWLEDVTAPEEELRPQSVRLAGASRGRLVAVGAVAIVVVLSVLAAFGVFSGSSSTTTPPTTSGQATTPAATAPATTPTQSTPPASLPAVVLKPGATGPNVKSLQRALAGAGQSPGAIDGVYGPKTEQAVSAFQGSAGITVDGVYGPQTKKALEQQANSG